MCGRYTITTPSDVVAGFFELATAADYQPRYNVAPTQEAPVVRVLEEADEDGRRLDLVRWGLVPFWADDPSIGNRMINARSETARDKPSFRDSFKKRRCLVVADGYYEWKKEKDGKQPHWFHRPDDEPFAFAGLWSRWDKGLEKGDPPLDTFTLLTRDASPEVKHIHHRMPVVLPKDAYTAWLDPELKDKDAVQEIVANPITEGWEIRRVSRKVNSPANDVPDVLREMED